MGQATWNAVARVLVLGLNAASGVLVARALLPEGRGVTALVIATATTTIALGYLSVEQSHVRLWAGRRDEILANSVLLGPTVGVLAALGSALLLWAGTWFGITVASPELLAMALASVPAGITALYLNGALTLDAQIALVTRSMLYVAVLQFGATALLAAAGWLTPGWVVAIWSASSASALLVLLARERPRLRFWNPGLARRAISLGLRFHPGSAALNLTLRLDVFILGALTSSAAVGLYALAVTVGGFARIPAEAVRGVFLSRQAEGELGDAVEATTRATRISTLLAAISVGGLCATAPVLIPLAYGVAFADSVRAMYALGPGLFLMHAGRQIGAYLIRCDRPLVVSAFPTAALGVNIVLNLVLIPRWGIVGCALAASVSYAVLTLAQVVRFCRMTGVRWRRLLPAAAEIAMLRQLLPGATGPGRMLRTGGLGRAARRRARGSAATAPPEHELVAAQVSATGAELDQLEAPVPEEPEDLLRPGHLERVPADPVDQVVASGHAPADRSGRELPGHDQLEELPERNSPV
ncbi:polysaccharide biosynthesis C-terminal domain-containing protein [Micromonospora sp. WMMD1102]|uniref:lipopolysaccharide biosynthesis protein n=1 Tax=Micromonospora sp. WMMD1102 TaxID=3016105 RepID=UPI003242DB5B